jgi:translation elongation factor EF-1beta
MGNVAVLFRIYTEPGNEEAVRKEIIKDLNPKGTELEEVAFGIKVVKVLFIHDDKTGSSDIEEKLKKIKNVNEVEVIEETLI